MEDNRPPIRDEIEKIKKESFAEIDVLHNTVDSVIKTGGYTCTNGIWDLQFTRVKDEQSMENGEKCELTSDTKGHIKIEDTTAVDVKVELQESGMDSLELDVLTEELDIKPDIESVDAELDSVANQIQTENRLGVVHRNSDQGAFICYICNLIVHSKKDLINHINVSGCSLKSRAGKALGVRHCIHCNATFKNKQGFDGHVIKSHEEFISSVSSKIHHCKHCCYKTTRLFNLTRHLAKLHAKQHPCLDCDAIFKSKLYLDDHVLKTHKEFISSVSSKIKQCRHCSYKTTSAYNLTRHMTNLHHVVVTPKQYPCIHCGVTFKRKVHLDGHVLRNHKESITSVSSKIYQCKHCSYKPNRLFHLTRHLLKVHPESGYSVTPEQYPCNHCHAIFKGKVSLDDHIIRNHEEFITSVSSKIHQCIHCSYKTTNATNLTHHLKKHPESGCSITPKQYACNHCHAIFKSRLYLDNHVLKTHEEFISSVSSNIHQCEYCSYKTTIASNLTRHLTDRPESGCSFIPKQYPCNHCHAIFKRKATLDYHIIRNHEEFITSVSSKIYQCKHCSYKTTIMAKLTRHDLSRHPK